MQISDRERFDALLEKLYAGFNMPISKARSDAYCEGLAKMPLSQFARCIEHCLGEHGPERIPSSAAIWKIWRELKHKSEPLPEVPKEHPDHLRYFANRLLFKHLLTRGGLGSKATFVAPFGMKNSVASLELAACLKAKAELVEFFTELIAEDSEHATPKDFVSHWVKVIQAVFAPITPAASAFYGKLIFEPRSRVKFAPHMIRKIA